MRRNQWLGLAVGGAVGLVLASGGMLTAQNKGTATGRVVAVDVVKVFAEYLRQKDLSEEMKQKEDQLQKENQTRRDSIEAAQAQVDRMDAGKDPLYAAKVRELLQMQIEYKN
ncbi:MAG: hypothetical protein HZB38_12250 [Planctomycetes bacterium]|nr:hypothetical protein [Planctomycetota bacterium]